MAEKTDFMEFGMESMEDSSFLEEVAKEEVEVPPTEDTEEIEQEIDINDPGQNPPPVEEEEEGEGEGESVVGDEDTQDNESTSSDNIFSSFASALSEEGVLSFVDVEEVKKAKSFEDIAEILRKEKRESEFAGMNDEQKRYLKALELGIPEEDFKANQKTRQTLSKITDDILDKDEELRKNLIINDFLSKGLSQEKAEKLAQRSFDLAADQEDAKEALANLKKAEESWFEQQAAAREKEIEEMAKENSKKLEDLKKLVFDEKEVIPGIPFNKATSEKVFKSLTQAAADYQGRPVNKVMQARLENPIDFDFKLHYLFEITKGFSDFSKLVNVPKKKALKDFEEKLELNSLQRLKGSRQHKPDSDYQAMLDTLENSLNRQ